MKALFLSLALSFTCAIVNATPSLYSEFSGYHKETGLSFKITQSSPDQWKVKIYQPCPSYPCSPEDFASTNYFMFVLLLLPNMADGGTEIALDRLYKITFVNNGMVPPKPDGTREESYWKLSVLNGSTGEIRFEVKLDFLARLKEQ
jgi:hypothetical protein